MRRFPILILALMLGVPLAHAEMLPTYDPEAFCEYIAGTSARQELVMRGCLDFQERTRKEIALAWDRVPVSVQESCSKVAQASGDYWKLKSCIDKQSPAAQATPGQ